MINFFFSSFIKDLKIAISYKVQFFSSFLSIFFTLFSLYYLSKMFNVDSQAGSYISNENYFEYIFIGVLSAEITLILISTLSGSIRNMQLIGIFEEYIISGRSELEIIFASYFFPIFRLIIRIIAYITFGTLLFEFELFEQTINYEKVVSFAFFITSLIGIALISASAAIIFKGGGFINSIYLGLTSILSGVAFPVNMLPNFLASLANFLPNTHFLYIIRLDSENNFWDAVFIFHFSMLIFCSLIVLFLGILLFNKAIKYSKQNGSLYTINQ